MEFNHLYFEPELLKFSENLPYIMFNNCQYLPILQVIANFHLRYFCGANGFFVNWEVFSVEEVRYWKDRDIDVFVWTVNDPAAKAYMGSLNMTLITDDCTVSKI